MQTLLEMWKASPWALAIGIVILACAITDTINKAIKNLTRRSVRFTAEDLDAIAKALADRLGEQPAQIDDDTLEAFADAVRERVNQVGLLASDIEMIAARTVEVADKYRQERLRIKAEQAEAAARMEAEQAATLEGFHVVGPVVPAEPAATPEPVDGEYKPDDLIEVLDDDEWCRGWYAGHYKIDEHDMTPHRVAWIDWAETDGDISINYEYVGDDQIRHRRPAAVPAAT